MNKPPLWFFIVAVLALLWNAAGLMAVIGDLRLSASDIAALPADQQALRAAVPGWSLAGSLLAVLGGTLGCLLLLLRKRWALLAFLVSLAGVVLQDLGIFVVAGAGQSANPAIIVLQGLVALVAVGLILLARRAQGRAWIA